MLHACYHGADRFLVQNQPARSLARLSVMVRGGATACLIPKGVFLSPQLLAFLFPLPSSLSVSLALSYSKKGAITYLVRKCKKKKKNVCGGSMISCSPFHTCHHSSSCNNIRFWGHCPDIGVKSFVLEFYFQSHYSSQHATQSFWLMCLALCLGAASCWRWTADAWCFLVRSMQTDHLPAHIRPLTPSPQEPNALRHGRVAW